MTLPKFQSTPPARAATATMDSWYMRSPVSIHAAREGGDGLHAQAAAFQSVSIHAAREGGDSAQCPHHTQAGCFNPRRPRGRRPFSLPANYWAAGFQSTPPARAATTGRSWRTGPPRVSIHAAREGGDNSTAASASPSWPFQSTPPARAATRERCAHQLPTPCFNPRRPRGRRPYTPVRGY